MRAGTILSCHIDMDLINKLLKEKIIDKRTASSLEYEVKVSGKRPEEVVLDRGDVNEDFLFKLKSKELNIPLKTVVPEDIPLEILELIPHDSAKYYRMIPLAKKEKTLEVGMVDPEDLKAREALKFLARRGGFDYKVFLITQSDFKALLKQYQTLKKEVKRALEDLEKELTTTGPAKKTVEKKEEFGKMAEEAPVTKVVAVMLRHAVEGKASDIHIEPTKKELRVRMRMDGLLRPTLFLPLKIHPAVTARIKILANLKIDETRIPQDGRFSTNFEGKNIDFRVSTFPTTLGEKVVIRVLNPMEGVKKFEDLGLEGRNMDVIKGASERSYGLILATGPTGSGKTTTLYAVLNRLNQEGVNITTLEDPVEYYVGGINQSQVKPEIGYTFARGLRHILRQDPDIIMVGEIRDEETAALAIHAALTGHIVLSTLHTNSALGVIPRLIDLQVAPFLIPSSLSVSIAQRLVRVLCPHCKKKVAPNKRVRDMIKEEMDKLPPKIKEKIKLPKVPSVYKPQGCKKCKDEGYIGRIALFEVLEMTPQLSEMVLEEPSESKIKQEADRQGMITMKQDGILKALDGVTSIEEVIRVSET